VDGPSGDPSYSLSCAGATTTQSRGDNRYRDWTTGNHPGYTLARRLHGKARQVWIFNQ
jgi:hypothetical protein